ncbi:MAG: hypothetical protein EHM39_11015 [Chloroflexi bacterium]|nr:MAG: hypothetical protein EHM39_11015 [Chloroflexota bacterium]
MEGPENTCALKTSAILIATGSDQGVYRSLEEVPQRLRKRLLQSTTVANSGTILIADRKGREELARALKRLPASWRRSVLSADPPEAGENREVAWWRAIASLALALALILVWFVFARN